MGANVDVTFSGSDPVEIGGGIGVGLNLNVPSLPPVAASVNVTNLPSVNANVNVTNLPTIHISVDALPKINVGLDPIRVILDPLRCHLPVDLSIGFNLFGHDLGAIRICGEAQFIAEPYVPNPCECPPAKE